MMKKNKVKKKLERRKKGLSEAAGRPVAFWISIGKWFRYRRRHTHTHSWRFQVCRSARFQFSKCGLTVSLVLRLFFFCLQSGQGIGRKTPDVVFLLLPDVSISTIQTIKRFFCRNLFLNDLMKIPSYFPFFIIIFLILLFVSFYP
jgi:hypothetical protein